MLNNKLLALASMLVLFGTAYASTTFTESGLSANAVWNVNVWSYSFCGTTCYNHNVNGSLIGGTNTILTLGGTTPPIPSFFRATSNTIPGQVFIGSVNVGGNTYINFTQAIKNATVNPAPYSTCFYSIQNCVTYLGSVPNGAGTLQSQVLGKPYTANLTIYVNPSGYFAYALAHNANGDIPSSLWLNVPPDQLALAPINLTQLNSLSLINSSAKNTSLIYGGAIFYSQIMDIAPIEYQQISANLTLFNFLNFVQMNEGSFSNTTLVMVMSNNTANGLGKFACIAESSVLSNPLAYAINLFTNNSFSKFESIGQSTNCARAIATAGSKIPTNNWLSTLMWASGTDTLTFGLLNGLLNTNPNIAQAYSTAEVSLSVSQSIPIVANKTNPTSNVYPLHVDYAFPAGFQCNIVGQLIGGVCVESGTKGMFDFNNYIDNTYAPQVDMSQFLTQTLPTIMIITLVGYLAKKMNGG